MKDVSSVIWLPSQSVAFRWLLVPRVLGAFFMHISDCDETYNYWEPVRSSGLVMEWLCCYVALLFIVVQLRGAGLVKILYSAHARVLPGSSLVVWRWASDVGVFTDLCTAFLWLPPHTPLPSPSNKHFK